MRLLRVECRSWIYSCPSIACNNFMASFPVLWLTNDDLNALELMTEIMKRLKEREQKQAKETVIITE